MLELQELEHNPLPQFHHKLFSVIVDQLTDDFDDLVRMRTTEDLLLYQSDELLLHRPHILKALLLEPWPDVLDEHHTL